MIIARWTSRSGKHNVALHHTEHGFKYVNESAGGYLAATENDEAITELQARIDSGYFQPDKNVTPMRRVYA